MCYGEVHPREWALIVNWKIAGLVSETLRQTNQSIALQAFNRTMERLDRQGDQAIELAIDSLYAIDDTHTIVRRFRRRLRYLRDRE